jgi:hypothetical protein
MGPIPSLPCTQRNILKAVVCCNGRHQWNYGITWTEQTVSIHHSEHILKFLTIFLMLHVRITGQLGSRLRQTKPSYSLQKVGNKNFYLLFISRSFCATDYKFSNCNSVHFILDQYNLTQRTSYSSTRQRIQDHTRTAERPSSTNAYSKLTAY